MTDEEARLPGVLLSKLLGPLLTREMLDELVIPALADLQYETAQVRQASVWRRAFVLTRGYLGVWKALAFCLATWPARYLQRDWLGAEAPGPLLTRSLVPRACIFGLGFTFSLGLMGAGAPFRLALVNGDPWLSLLGLPMVLSVVVPLAFLFGLVLALCRLRRLSSTLAGARLLGAIVCLSMATGLLTFGLCGWVTPDANQSFLQRAFPRDKGAAPLLKGPRELTLGELQALLRAGHREDTRLVALREGTRSVALYVEWHKKWAIPGTCLVFGPLAVGLTSLSRRHRLLTAFALASAATCFSYAALRYGEVAALRGQMGPLPAIWSGNVLLALVTCWLIGRSMNDDHSRRDPALDPRSVSTE